jgi:hypothetical protein
MLRDAAKNIVSLQYIGENHPPVVRTDNEGNAIGGLAIAILACFVTHGLHQHIRESL